MISNFLESLGLGGRQQQRSGLLVVAICFEILDGLQLSLI
jgi:hypothetical protein